MLFAHSPTARERVIHHGAAPGQLCPRASGKWPEARHQQELQGAWHARTMPPDECAGRRLRRRQLDVFGRWQAEAHRRFPAIALRDSRNPMDRATPELFTGPSFLMLTPTYVAHPIIRHKKSHENKNSPRGSVRCTRNHPLNPQANAKHYQYSGATLPVRHTATPTPPHAQAVAT